MKEDERFRHFDPVAVFTFKHLQYDKEDCSVFLGNDVFLPHFPMYYNMVDGSVSR